MGKNQLELFCTSGDLATVLNDVQEHSTVSFAVAGLFDTANLHTLASPAEVLAFIATQHETMQSILAVGVGDPVTVREIPQRNGRVRYGVDQVSNPRSVVLRPGKLIDDRTLLAGQIGTASGDPVSLKLFATFAKAVRKHYVKVQAYWVGSEAGEILDAGGRLVATLKAPREYDLKR